MFTNQTLVDAKGDPSFVAALTTEEITQLIDLLREKDNELRYAAFLAVQNRSVQTPDIYPYWDVFVAKMDDTNSYQRSIGAMLIAENVRWDETDRFAAVLNAYMDLCDDEKFITARQCIQALSKITPYKPQYRAKIASALMDIDMSERKSSQQKLLLQDIIDSLLAIEQSEPSEDIVDYIHGALKGGLIPTKEAKAIRARFPQS